MAIKMKKRCNFCIIILSHILLLLFLISAGTAGTVSESETIKEYILKTIICCLITVIGYLISVKILDSTKNTAPSWDVPAGECNPNRKTKAKPAVHRRGEHLSFSYISKKYISEPEKEKIKPKFNTVIKISLSLLSLLLLLITSLLFKKYFNAEAIQKTKIIPDTISHTKKIYCLLPLIFLRNALIPAFFEEYYFRKKLPGTLSQVCNISYPLAFFISSLLFCSAHTGGIYHVFFAFISAAVLGLLVYYTDTLKYAVTVHFIYNCITVILLL